MTTRPIKSWNNATVIVTNATGGMHPLNIPSGIWGTCQVVALIEAPGGDEDLYGMALLWREYDRRKTLLVPHSGYFGGAVADIGFETIDWNSWAVTNTCVKYTIDMDAFDAWCERARNAGLEANSRYCGAETLHVLVMSEIGARALASSHDMGVIEELGALLATPVMGDRKCAGLKYWNA